MGHPTAFCDSSHPNWNAYLLWWDQAPEESSGPWSFGKKKSVVSFQKITLLYHERDGCEKLTYHLSSCHWQPVKRGSSVDEPAIIANEARWAMQRFYNASGLFFASCPISMILNETQEFVHAMCLAGQLLRFEGCCFTFSRSAQVIPKLGSCIQLPSSSAHGTLD